MTIRIAIAGFQHETNTFAPDRANLDNFINGDGWPGLKIGEEIIEGMIDKNIPISGFIKEGKKRDFIIEPIIWTAASPSGPVTSEAFDYISHLILEKIKKITPIDYVYLDLHGAMVSDEYDDGEGEILKKIRDIVGPDCVICVSLDLHANVSDEMFHYADFIYSYRTYPHIDMAKTGKLVAEVIDKYQKKIKEFNFYKSDIDFLIPLHMQCTLMQPAKKIYENIKNIELDDSFFSFTMGFPAADVYFCGPKVFVYSLKNINDLSKAVNQLIKNIYENANEFYPKFYSESDAIKFAIENSKNNDGPIVIADTQDNPGAGGTCDTTGLLKELVKQKASNSAIGLIFDKETAKKSHEVGIGNYFDAEIGGKLFPGDSPLEVKVKVVNLSNGNLKCEGAFYKGFQMELGKSALLEIEPRIFVVVSSSKPQMADRELYKFVGVNPEKMRILVNKSSVHFRADFEPIAKEIIVAKSDGAMSTNMDELNWKKINKKVKLMPPI